MNILLQWHDQVKPGWITAKTADINDLYERSVQCPESEVDLIFQAWGELWKREPVTIREDFCGTSAVAREWVRETIPVHGSWR